MPFVKIAVAQIVALPALRFGIPNPPETYLVEGENSPFLFPFIGDMKADCENFVQFKIKDYPQLQQNYEQFGKTYREALERQIERIVRVCAAHDVSLIVFPEYSIPWRICESVAKIARTHEVSIIAGTHGVELKDIRSRDYPYAEDVRGWFVDGMVEIAVSPIFSANGDRRVLVPKQVLSRYDAEDIEPVRAADRSAIELRVRGERQPLRVALAICSEFLRAPDPRELGAADLAQALQEGWEEADVIAIPSWSPVSKNFQREIELFLDRRRHGGSVALAYCNMATHGGSSIITKGDTHGGVQGNDLERQIEGLLIRKVRYGSGGGSAFAPPFAPEKYEIIYEGRFQHRLWQLVAEVHQTPLSAAQIEAVRKRLMEVPENLPHPLDKLREAIVRQLNQSSVIGLQQSTTIEQYIVLQARESVASALLRFYAKFNVYLSQLVYSSQWRPQAYSGFHGVVVKKLALLADHGVTDVEAQDVPQQDGLPQSRRGAAWTDAGMSEDDWAHHVNTRASQGDFHFAIRIVTIPGEDSGIAYQTRFIAQIIDMIARDACIRKLQLRIVTGSYSGAPNVEIFLLFQFGDGFDAAALSRLSQEVYRICSERLLAYRLVPLSPVNEFFRDFGGDTLDQKNGYSVYIGRKTLQRSPLAFTGRGEASSIIKLLVGLKKITRFTITLEKVETRAGGTTALEWRHDAGDGRGRLLTGEVQTPVRDLQVLQDAVSAVSFQPALFMPEGDNGSRPIFPAQIKFESSVPGLELIPRAIGHELAGPDRYEVVSEDPKIVLSERELFHIFKLPFGQIPGFAPPSPENLVLSRQDVPKPEGLVLGEVAVKGEQRAHFHWNTIHRSRHMYVLGKTGTGKSYFLSNLISRDIEVGNGVMVIDPHGDLIESVLRRIPKERIGDVHLFDPGDTNFPPGLNLLEFDLTDPFQRSLVLEEAVSIFLTLYGPEIFGPRIQQYFRGATLSLMDYGEATRAYPTLIDVARIFLDDDFQTKVRGKVRDPVASLFWKEVDKSAPREKQEIIPYFQAKFGPLITNRMIRNVIGQRHSQIRFDEALARDAIVLVNLSKGKIGDINADLLGLILIAKLNWAIMARARLPFERRTLFSLYVDEFQNFASTTFSKMLSEARKYGLSMVLANQYLSQLRLQSAYTRVDPDHLISAVLGNVGTLVCFQGGREDSQRMALEMDLDTKTKLLGDTQKNPILNLPIYQAILSTLGNGKRLPPCYLYSLRWIGDEDEIYGRNVEAFLKHRACRPMREVERDVEADLKDE